MRHSLQIAVSTKPPNIRLMEMRRRRVPNWLWHRLFGSRRIVVLFPGDSVDEVTITEKPGPEGG